MPARLVALVLAIGALLVLVAESPHVVAQRQPQQQVADASEHLTAAKSTTPPLIDNHDDDEKRAEMPRILDFVNYKKIFKKRYSGWREELVRCKLFMSRAMRTVLSAMRYQTGYDSYYLAVNHMSDWTPEQRERMNNKQLEEYVKQHSIGSNRRNSRTSTNTKLQLPEELYLDDTRPETIMAELAKHSGERAAQELKRLGEKVNERKKREVRGENERVHRRRRRKLTMDELIKNPVSNSVLPPRTRKKMRARVPTNNANYAGQIEPMTMGLGDQQQVVNFIKIDPAPTATFGTFLALVNEQTTAADVMDIDSGNAMPDAETDADMMDIDSENSMPEEPDVIYTDLRRTNCFLAPRNQGECGCCYAFSIVTIVEYLHCIKTGQLVAFSEQYIVDCGRGYIPTLSGCSGGQPVESGQFVHNFGMELLVNYPYLERENQCPYEPNVDLKTTGYIRTEIGNGVAIDEQLWPEYLKYGPMWVGVITSGDDFNAYAGGVHQPDCRPELGHHAMVLIGHGRQDGLEYWLFRSSFGTAWGEGGYYKMARSAACIVTPGFMYGTSDGRQFEMILERNWANDDRFVGLNYARTMLAHEQPPPPPPLAS